MVKRNTIYLADDDTDDRYLLIEALTSGQPPGQCLYDQGTEPS
jgi:hypothetical protein